MKKIELISKIIYIIYLVYTVVSLLVLLSGSLILSAFTYNIGFMNLTGGFAFFIFIVYTIAYNIFLVIFVYQYCNEKGYPGFTWLVISIFVPHYFGLIAFIALIRYQAQARKIYRFLTLPHYNENEVKCKHCDHYLDPSYLVCPHCGEHQHQVCKKCGAMIKAGYIFCSECGENV